MLRARVVVKFRSIQLLTVQFGHTPLPLESSLCSGSSTVGVARFWPFDR